MSGKAIKTLCSPSASTSMKRGGCRSMTDRGLLSAAWILDSRTTLRSTSQMTVIIKFFCSRYQKSTTWWVAGNWSESFPSAVLTWTHTCCQIQVKWNCCRFLCKHYILVQCSLHIKAHSLISLMHFHTLSDCWCKHDSADVTDLHRSRNHSNHVPLPLMRSICTPRCFFLMMRANARHLSSICARRWQTSGRRSEWRRWERRNFWGRR